MGNLATQGGGGNALAAYGGVNPWAEAARGVADGAYLKFNGNKGDLTFGSDDEDLPVGSRIIIDMNSPGVRLDLLGRQPSGRKKCWSRSWTASRRWSMN
jgi:hypothetical protein